jgi:hypothetical protein
MTRSPSILLSLLGPLLAVSAGAKAQTADEIISKYVTALGNREIHSVYQEGVAVLQNGTEVDSKTWKVENKLYRQEISFGMGEVVIIVTPQQGWSSNPRTGGSFTAMPPEQLKGLQSQMDPAGPLVNYAAKGHKAELLGKDTVNGKECYKLKLTLASGPDITYSIDENTFYILRETHKATQFGGGAGTGAGGGSAGGGGGRRAGNPNATFDIDFSDYQKTPDGYIFPYTIVTSSFGAKSSVTKLEVNKAVDVETLSKPK